MLIFSEQEKNLKLSTKIKTIILVSESDYLIRSPDCNDHSKTTFMMINGLPEQKTIKNKNSISEVQKLQSLFHLTSRTSVVLKLFLPQTSMLLQNVAKGWNSLGHWRSNLWAAEL